MAQLVEHPICTRAVGSSSLSASTINLKKTINLYSVLQLTEIVFVPISVTICMSSSDGVCRKKGHKYSARLVIPKALRPTLGQNEFKKSLRTSSKTEAELSAAPLILHWKKLIEDAKTSGVIAKAKALRRALDNSPNSDLIDKDGFWESTKAGIIENVIEDIIL